MKTVDRRLTRSERNKTAWGAFMDALDRATTDLHKANEEAERRLMESQRETRAAYGRAFTDASNAYEQALADLGDDGEENDHA